MAAQTSQLAKAKAPALWPPEPENLHAPASNVAHGMGTSSPDHLSADLLGLAMDD